MEGAAAQQQVQANPFQPLPQEQQQQAPEGFGSAGARRRAVGTLDETVWATLMRDARRVAVNTKSVLLPAALLPWRWGSDDSSVAAREALREWDLYGPAIFVLLLSLLVSIGHSEAGTDGGDSIGLVFSIVFTTVALGSVVVTVNCKALGGTIMFFQSLSMLGYCIFPLVLSAALCLPVGNRVWRCLVVLGGVTWCCLAALPYVGAAVPENRRALAVYPFFLMALMIGTYGEDLTGRLCQCLLTLHSKT